MSARIETIKQSSLWQFFDKIKQPVNRFVDIIKEKEFEHVTLGQIYQRPVYYHQALVFLSDVEVKGKWDVRVQRGLWGGWRDKPETCCAVHISQAGVDMLALMESVEAGTIKIGDKIRAYGSLQDSNKGGDKITLDSHPESLQAVKPLLLKGQTRYLYRDGLYYLHLSLKP